MMEEAEPRTARVSLKGTFAKTWAHGYNVIGLPFSTRDHQSSSCAGYCVSTHVLILAFLPPLAGKHTAIQ